MINTTNIPFYIKFAFVAVGVISCIFVMYICQQIILPLIYATILAIMLNPFVNFLTKKGISKTFAILFAVILSLLVIICLIYFISLQVTLFSETYPALKEKFIKTLSLIVQWISSNFNIRRSQIDLWISKTQDDYINNLRGSIGQTISAINNIIIIIVLLPVYLFMILYYKTLLLEFIRKLFNKSYHATVTEVLYSSKKIIQSYLSGLLLEALIIAVLNSLGLLILGIDYAIILGITGALLNVIPYIGGVIAIALPMIVAYVTKDSSTYALLVLLIYLLIQFIDNHYIIPRIVASRVKLNALISVVAVIAGGTLWGIPGMFLSIPITAILKVIFDHIENLKPWGFLLGNMMPTSKIKMRKN